MLKRTGMSASFVSDECDRDQNYHYDEDDALFVLREFKHSEQAFHVIAGQLVISLAFSIC